MNWRQPSRPRTVAVYLGALIVACLLTEIGWGLVGGMVAGHKIARSPEYRKEVAAFLATRGLDPHADAKAVRIMYTQLTPEDRAELNRMSLEVLREANWFAVTVVISLLAFGLTGLLGGWLAHTWRPAALIPALSFLINNPVVRFPMARNLDALQQAAIVVLQFGVCVGLAVVGMRWAARRRNGADAVGQREQVDSGTAAAGRQD